MGPDLSLAQDLVSSMLSTAALLAVIPAAITFALGMWYADFRADGQ